MSKEEEQEPLLGEVDPKPKSFVKAMILCGVMMILYMSGLISLVPLLSQYIRVRVAESYSNNTNGSVGADDVCKRNNSDDNVRLGIKIQEEASELMLFIMLPGSIVSIFVNLLLGSYSDFLGRRFLFFVPTFGATLKATFMCFIIGFNMSLNWAYLAYLLEGCTGGFTAFLLAVFAYTADVTTPGRKRTFMIALMEGILAVAGAVGQLAVGFIIEDVSYLFAAIMVAAIFGIALLVVVTVLPETMTNKMEKQWSPLPHVKKVFGFFFTRGSGKQRAMYILALLIFYFGVIVNLGRTSVETLYQLDRPFCWSPLKIGYYGAIKLSFTVACSVIGLKLLQPCFRDMTIALIGLAFGAASFVMEGLAVNDWMLYSVPVIGFIAFNVVPVSRATMSKMTSPLEQGALFSSIAAMETICNTMSNTLYNAVYQSTVGVFRGAVFIMMAGFGVLTAGLIVVFLCISRDSGDLVYEVTVPPPSEGVTVNKEATSSVPHTCTDTTSNG
ncbi:solute carrier family 46 member 3-like [Haliotis rubra]|uniref:solute carrier family 46 member 3-like n=1 Tax=Haliotis rubra TaxID=36100 RepID=UPI001EE5D561|nr:solute carrier family 46 member 3-like [Haliotis rubra]XP_046575157.1 solute carrier family 46 member 3-like [Haliotis rubra]XP_046575158.1 solute carrier family 46 member 3-like [Haliotis rubra]